MWFASSEYMGRTYSTSDYGLILQQGRSEIIYPGLHVPPWAVQHCGASSGWLRARYVAVVGVGEKRRNTGRGMKPRRIEAMWCSATVGTG